MLRLKIPLICFFFNMISIPVFCQAPNYFWLSGQPPEQFQSKLKIIGMQNYYGIPGRPGKEKFALWLCYGNSPENKQYLDTTLTSGTCVITGNSNNDMMNYSLEKGRLGFALIYDFGKEGYNNIFIIDSFVHDHILHVSVAKAERISHKCMNGHKKIKQLVRLKEYADIPFQIYRKRNPKGENLHILLQSGQIVTFIVKQQDKKSQNTSIRFISHKGWQKTETTNNEGEATFQIPQDYFSNLTELNQEKMSWFVVVASKKFDSSGSYQNKQFDKVFMETTYSGEYIPSEMLYKSKLLAFTTITLGILLVIILVYFYRKNRPKYILN